MEVSVLLKRLSQKLRAKKIINFYNPFFSITNLAFLSFSHIISKKATATEYLDVIVLLESLDLTTLLEYLNLTTQYINPKGGSFETPDTHLDPPLLI